MRETPVPNMNIVEPILFQARCQPEAPALCAQGRDFVSYARLVAEMNNVARRATSFGLKRGDVVALSIDNQLLHSIVILGLMHAGIIPLSIAMQKPPSGLKIDAVISNTNYPFAPNAKHLSLDSSWTERDGAPVATSPAGNAARDEVCRIVLTSGTTGEPKAVALTHRLVAERNAQFEYLFGNRFPTLSRLYLNIGLGASLGGNFLTYFLGRGGTVFFPGDSIESTLLAFEMFQIQAMLATPTTLARLLATCDRQPSIEVHLDTIVSTGSQLPQALVERIRPRHCSQLFVGYGSTETARSAAAAAHQIAHVPGAAGYVAPDARIEIVDEADRGVPAGTEGIVRIASEFAVDRYIDDPIESAKVFRDGWFYPGDLGSLTADNLLIISGRQNDVLNVGGAKMAAERLESVLASFDGISDAAVFAATSPSGIDEVWAAVVCSGKLDPESLRVHCRSQIGGAFVPAHVVSLEALPITATGKVDRQGLKRILMAGNQS
jgi:acyl-CoA synthetase (AMP-forming)/AMP-acid ligase II